MNILNPGSPPLTPLFTAQLDAIFANGVVVQFVYHRSGVSNVSFSGVVDQFPMRLTGVNPGDIRVRVRAADLALISWPGPSDYITDLSNVSADVISSAIEFGGVGIALQCRRRAIQAESQASPSLVSFHCVTRAERDAMTNLSAGMVVFQTDSWPGLRVFNGANWMRFEENID